MVIELPEQRHLLNRLINITYINGIPLVKIDVNSKVNNTKIYLLVLEKEKHDLVKQPTNYTPENLFDVCSTDAIFHKGHPRFTFLPQRFAIEFLD